jgi:SAM-dependent methyltransferase
MQRDIYRQLFELEDGHWWFRGRRAVVNALLDRAQLPAELRILDAGCGTGRNMTEYRSRGEVAGIDPSPDAITFCHARGLTAVAEGRIERLPFGDGAFDLVTATDVLEHIADDLAAAQELRRVTHPAGRLLVTVPAYRWLWSNHDESHHHHRRYTLRGLRATLAEAGWRPVLRTYYNSALLPPIAMVRAVRRDSQHSDYDVSSPLLNRALVVPMRAEATLIRAGMRLPFGVSIAMVCAPA